MSWSVEQSRERYNFAGWGDGYFDANTKGHLVVRLASEGRTVEVDLYELADEIRSAGLKWPVLLRCNAIIRDRVDRLCAAFEQARTRYGYEGRYTAAYPIKVNQQFSVVRQILEHGGERVGLEAQPLRGTTRTRNLPVRRLERAPHVVALEVAQLEVGEDALVGSQRPGGSSHGGLDVGKRARQVWRLAIDRGDQRPPSEKLLRLRQRIPHRSRQTGAERSSPNGQDPPGHRICLGLQFQVALQHGLQAVDRPYAIAISPPAELTGCLWCGRAFGLSGWDDFRARKGQIGPNLRMQP